MISAAHKSSGKTVFSMGLLAVLRECGLLPQAFKKGPDYIDPCWLAYASGGKCYNLDFNTQETNELYSFFRSHGATKLSLIEGSKGLYDDIYADARTSSAALACLLQTPVILVVDCEGITTGIAPLLLGYMHFRWDINIAGVILNRVGGARHQAKLQNAIDGYVGLPIYGAIGRDERMVLPERHLGLLPQKEMDDAQSFVDGVVEVVKSCVDYQQLVHVAQSVIKTTPKKSAAKLSTPSGLSKQSSQETFKLGVVFDRAFHFYYPDDLESFITQGAAIIYIDSINDSSLPKDLDGLFIGGGFPELQAAQLEQNKSLRAQIKAAIEDGMPCYAECGGLMYLSRSIEWQGKKHAMVGIIPADAVMHEKPYGRGYVKAYESEAMPWEQIGGNEACVVSGHEFHYANLVGDLSQYPMAFEVLFGGEGIQAWQDGFLYKNLLATFLHQRATASNLWTKRFTKFILQHKQAKASAA